MIDTHCHLYHEYYNDLDQLIADIYKKGVTKIIINGCDMKSNLEVLELVKKYDIDFCMQFLSEHANDKKIVAIGEIGLDYHYDDTDKINQINLFKRQLEIASKYNKPVIVHTRDSIQDTYDILSNYKLRGSIHAYSGSLEMAREFIKLGFYIGVGGVCTFKNAKNIISVIENIDLSYLLLETDSPYLAPVPYRGKINSPAYIPIIVDKIADVKKISSDLVVKITTNNAEGLFDF